MLLRGGGCDVSKHRSFVFPTNLFNGVYMESEDVVMENGEDFSQDVQTDQGFGQGQKLNGQNGSGDGPTDSGSADAPGRDDDR